PAGPPGGRGGGPGSQADQVGQGGGGTGGVPRLEPAVDGQGGGDGARVDEDAVVDEERGRPLPEPLAAEGPEHLDLHWCRILAYPGASRRCALAGVHGATERPRSSAARRRRASLRARPDLPEASRS